MYKLSNVNYHCEKKIYYISYYHQYWLYDDNNERRVNPDFNNYNGGYILDVKNNKAEGINFYTNKLSEIIINNIELILNEWIINVVPSHTVNTFSIGLTKIAENLSNKYMNIKLRNFIGRKVQIDKLSSGGDRSIKVQLESLGIYKNADIANKNIILIDDVTTTGNSLIACRKYLEHFGANKVLCIALGKTVPRKTYEEVVELPF